MGPHASRHAGLVVALLSFGAVALAVALQVLADMAPCAWCTFQRLLYLLVGALALAGWLATPGGSRPTGRRLGGLTCNALALLTALGGAAAALWQQLVASRSASCALTFADRVVKGLGLDEVRAVAVQGHGLLRRGECPADRHPVRGLERAALCIALGAAGEPAPAVPPAPMTNGSNIPATMTHSLDQLKLHTIVVADTGDFDSMRAYAPRDATTNPTLILKAVGMPAYRTLLDETVAAHRRRGCRRLVRPAAGAIRLAVARDRSRSGVHRGGCPPASTRRRRSPGRAG
jgi:disulfide bond formation protein DsbB